jgi:hypothetical protein
VNVTGEVSSGEIERFLAALAKDGFDIGVRESLRMHELSAILTERNVAPTHSELRAMFAALIAHDSTEQRRVAELFDATFNDAEPGLRPLPPTPTTARTPEAPPSPKQLGQLLAAIAAIAGVGLFLYLYLPHARQTQSTPIDTHLGGVGAQTQASSALPASAEWTTDRLYSVLDRMIKRETLPALPTLHEMQSRGWPPKEATGGIQLPLPALVERLRLPPDWPVYLNADATRRRIMSAFTDFGIPARLPRKLEGGNASQLDALIDDLASALDKSNIGATNFIGLSQSQRVRKVSEVLQKVVDDDVIDRALAVRLGEPRDGSKIFSDSTWKPVPPSALTRVPAWLRPTATAAPLLFAAAWFLNLARRRHNRITIAAKTSPPLDHRLVLEAPSYIRTNRIDKGYLMRVAASLNVRQTIATHVIDRERTVWASIAAGGLFTPVTSRVTVTPAYLLFVEAKGAGDQEARRLEMLHLRLVDAGVKVKRFFYFDSPAFLHEEFGGNPWTIEDVAANFEDRRLIIFGEGRGFLTLLRNTPQPWAHILDVWPQRAMLTPRPLKEWGAQEFAIANALGLPLGRATIEGLFALADLLGLDEGRDRPVFKAYGFSGGSDLKPLPALIRSQPFYWLSENDPGETDAKRLDSVLQYYLDGEGFLWLKALAVYPVLQWGLTLYLGRELDVYEEPRLAALTRLPWLTEGHMPLWLRRRFIASLGDDVRIRTIAAIHRIMAADDASPGPQLAKLRSDPMRLPSLRGRDPSRDRLFLETLAKEGDFPAPAWLRPSLRVWFAALSWRELGVVIAACGYAAAAWWLVPAGGVLGPGGLAPLTALALLSMVGWLGVAWLGNRPNMYGSIASWCWRVLPRTGGMLKYFRSWRQQRRGFEVRGYAVARRLPLGERSSGRV